MKISWKNIFNWNIKDVSDVITVKDARGRTEGYKVIISYQHHGDETLYFDMYQENLYTQYKGPQDAAQCACDYYKKKKIQQQMRLATVRQK